MRFSSWGRVATFGCGSQFMPIAWDFTPACPGMYTTMCTYEPATGAWATCIDQVIRQHTSLDTPEAVFGEAIHWVNLVCRKAGCNLAQFTVDEYSDIFHNASNYLIEKPAPSPEKLHTPVLIDYRSRERIIDAVHAEFANLDNSNDSILWIYYYFVAVLAILMLLQFTSLRNFTLRSRLINRIRARFELPTIWLSEKHSQHVSSWALGGLLPTSLETVLLLGFFIVHTMSLGLNYSVDPREVMEPVRYQLLQGLGNRSGIVSFGLLPLIIGLSSRSTLLPKLTGMRYTTFLVLHRWIGRIMVVDAVIHSIAFYYHEYLVGALPNASAQYWWVIGIAATVLSLVISGLATGALRSRWYETFLYTHIVLALVFFYFCWEHVRTFGWTYWIFASCMIWAVERLNRIRLLYANGISKAEATIVSEDLLVLTIPKPKRWKDHPTQYAFVHFLLPSTFWQSHPFTVTDAGNDLKIVILVKSGATRHLYRAVQHRAVNDGSKSTSISVILEGPYGASPNLEMFDNIVLISGGSGIPGPLAAARELSNQTYHPNWAGVIHFVAVVREYDIYLAYQEQLEDLLNSHRVHVDLHYTGKEGLNRRDAFALSLSRPNVEHIIYSALMDSQSLAVICCGPPGLNDRTRNIVAKLLAQHTAAKLEYFEEYQIW